MKAAYPVATLRVSLRSAPCRRISSGPPAQRGQEHGTSGDAPAPGADDRRALGREIARSYHSCWLEERNQGIPIGETIAGASADDLPPAPHPTHPGLIPALVHDEVLQEFVAEMALPAGLGALLIKRHLLTSTGYGSPPGTETRSGEARVVYPTGCSLRRAPSEPRPARASVSDQARRPGPGRAL